MKYIIFDTETTGLPADRKIPADKKPNNWPHIVSISWAIIDRGGVSGGANGTVSKNNYIIRPQGWIVPPESTAFHRITHDHAMEVGASLADVLLTFFDDCVGADLILAHNLEFDYNVVLNACVWDLQFPIRMSARKECTMLHGMPICKIPSQFRGKYKWPTLPEFYEFVCYRKPDLNKTHSSLYDIELLIEIVQKCPELRKSIGLNID